MAEGFAHRVVYHSKQHGDYGPALKRGQCRIEHDGHVIIYQIKRGERKAFKAWYSQISQIGLTAYRVVGAWPDYRMKRLG